MFYFKVLPAINSYKSDQPLTYSFNGQLNPGQLVTVSLRGRTCPAIILSSAPKPNFTAKEITSVADLPALPTQLIELAGWLNQYYASGLGPVGQLLVNANYLKVTRLKQNQTTNKKTENKLPALTQEQNLVLSSIKSGGTYLLHGETGSGKTRIYIELTKKTLDSGKSAIILTPEIGLTAQLARDFYASFGEKVIVIHSGLTPAERRTAWQKMLKATEALIVIGPRSALFSPLKKIGLIAIDESHDSSYKQGDAPHYSANTVAAKLAQLHNCPLILGSATPSIFDYYLASSRGRPILRLTKPAKAAAPVSVRLLDIKDRSHFSKSQYLSNELLAAMETAVSKREQVLLYLNRRGTARVVLCSDCGWIAECPHCDLPLTYHADSHNLRCHTCGYKQFPPTFCPNCGSNDLSFRGAGSKAIEAEVKKLFPKASVKRFDADNPKAERLEQIYSSVSRGDIDIIIGTQVVSKGLDLPRLAVVGMIVADTNLYLPDFSAGERTYQQIRQVIGRVGRGHRPGTAIVQSYAPKNLIIKAALSGNFLDFYKHESLERQKFYFPPATHLLKLIVRRASAQSAEAAAGKLKQLLANNNKRLTIDGPTPCFHELRSGKYHWQIVIKSKHRQDLIEVLNLIPANVSFELDPVSLL